MNKFKTCLYSFSELGERTFVIPTYQRPYVWDDEQVYKLLDDFKTAFSQSQSQLNSNPKPYFIGTIMTSLQNGVEELIDGQQRFTTLLLIAAAFKAENIDCEISQFIKNEKGVLRLGFAIRKKTKKYLELSVENIEKVQEQFSVEEIEGDTYLTKIAKAITTIRNWLKESKMSLEEKIVFGNYIYREVQFIKNTAPDQTDLNKLFSTINNSGIQLEQTDILKSNLLKHIKTDKLLYSRAWEACENMNNYFERNVRQLFSKIDWATLSIEDLSSFDVLRSRLEERPQEELAETTAEFSIAEILQQETKPEIKYHSLAKKYQADDDSEEIVYCKSIISFGQLLLHAYRIYLKEKGNDDFEQPFHVNRLLAIFKSLWETSEAPEKEVKLFVKCLWSVRYIFDREIVKWIAIPGEKDQQLRLTDLKKTSKKNKEGIYHYHYHSRTTSRKNNLSMLQSVLYFTSNYNTQIWLSAYLYKLLQNKERHKSEEILETIDNELSLSTLQGKQGTRKLMDEESIVEKIDFSTYLRSSEGTSFLHYWFQKLEYILWKGWEDKKVWKFEQYRITSKNSIEHIFPQKEEHGKKLEKKILDAFGNLTLLSVSQNSQYSNQSVAKKQLDFEGKRSYDALKLAHFFNTYNEIKHENRSVNQEALIREVVQFHQKEMIDLLKNHYANTVV